MGSKEIVRSLRLVRRARSSLLHSCAAVSAHMLYCLQLSLQRSGAWPPLQQLPAGRKLSKRSLLDHICPQIRCSSLTDRDPTSAERTLFIFGFGYVAHALSEKLLDDPRNNWKISGTSRGAAQSVQFPGGQVSLFPFGPNELLSARGAAALSQAAYVLDSIPPYPIKPSQAAEGPGLCLQHCEVPRMWYGYLSSTSVYGGHNGAWVDERAQLLATAAKGKARVEAEQSWLQLNQDLSAPVHIFRLGGIYGPGRSGLDAVRKAEPSASQQRRFRAAFTARVHVDDICQVLIASMQQPNPGAVYNVVDDDPAARSQVLHYASMLLNQDGRVDDSSMAPDKSTAKGRASEADPDSKRVSNAKIKAELGIRLQHPTYREGLQAIYEQERSAGI